MKNITFSAKEEDIEKARKIAEQKHSTLNTMFREWLGEVNKNQGSDKDISKKLDALWVSTSYLRVGRKLSREEMNER